MARKAYKIAKGAEKKYYQYTSESGNVLWTGDTITFLNDLPQGTNQAERIGQQIYLWTMKIYGSVNFSSTNADLQQQRMRIMLIYYKGVVQHSGTTITHPTLSDYFSTGDQYAVYRPYQNIYEGTFRVLYDKIFNLHRDSPVRKFTIRKKICRKMHYENTDNTPTNSCLQLIFVSDNETDGPSYHFVARAIYYDS